MKKIFKILSGIVLLLVVSFLLAGLVVPKVEYTSEIKIDRPVQEVWAKYNDLNSISEWIPEIKSIKTIKEIPGRVGSQYEMVVENEGQTITMVETITSFKMLEEVGLSFDIGNMIKKDLASFSEKDGSTIIFNQHICEGNNYLTKCMFAFFKGSMKSTDQYYMDQFKAWAEGN